MKLSRNHWITWLPLALLCGMSAARAAVEQYDLGPDDNRVNRLLVRIDFQADGDKDRVSVWRNPPMVTTSPPDADASDVKHDIRFDRISLANFTQDGTCGPADFDAIRFGATAEAALGQDGRKPLLSEPFDLDDYDPDRSLAGQAPPVPGFQNPWRRTGGDQSRVVEGSLSPEGVAASGARLVLGHRSRVIRDLDTSPDGPLGNYVDSAGDISQSEDGSPLFISLMMRHASERKTDVAILELRHDADHRGEHLPLAVGVRNEAGHYRARVGVYTATAKTADPRIPSGPPREDALLYRKLPIPKPLLITRDGHTFGGDLRIGDLNGDGRCDLLVYRCNHGAPRGAHRGGMKPTFLGAFDLDGRVLWQAGGGGNHPSRPMSVAVKDWTGDGADDVICFWHKPRPDLDTDWQTLADVAIQLRDGRTGHVLREAAPEAITARRRKDPIGANWVHQRLLIANFRGSPEARDVVVKLGDTYVALDEQLNVLWTYTSQWKRYSRCPAYIPAVGDIDDDGRDELNGGYFVIDDDGTPLWEEQLGRNMDSVTIDRWAGRMRAICSGYGHVMSAQGDVILKLGKELVPHGQEVRVADFHHGYQGNEMVLRAYGHKTPVHLVSSETNTIIDTIDLQFSPTNVGMEAVYWDGPERRTLLFNGGWLWDMEKAAGWELPNLPPPNGGAIHRMGFYHVIPANLCGDNREELVIWDPTAAHVYIYTPKPLDESITPDYHHGPRQYNPRLMD